MTLQPPPKKSLSLAEGSNPPINDSEHSPERRLLPRLTLSSEQFRLTLNGKVFGVADLSQTGMALRLLDLNDRLLFPIGMRFSGTLNVNRLKHAVEAQVKNLRGDHVGCQFTQISSELASELSSWLDPAQLGSSLRIMPQSAHSDSIWYNGRSGTEVLIWPHQPSGISRMLIVLWGREYVEWNATEGVRTGELKAGTERDSAQGVLRWAPEWLHEDAAADPAKLNLAKTLLLSSKLPEEWKRQAQSGLVLPA